MKRMIKYAAVASVAGALALGMASPTQAAEGRNTAAAIGFGAGALFGATAANAADYGPRGPAYADRRGYAPGYGAYAYAPERGSFSGCVTQGTYGQGPDYSACGH